MTSKEALQHLVARALENGTDRQTAEAIEVLGTDAKELDDIRTLRAQIAAKQPKRAQSRAEFSAILLELQQGAPPPEPIGDTCAECGEGRPAPGRSWCASCIDRSPGDL